MKGRVSAEEDRLADLFEGVVEAAHVYQGGGNLISGDTFRQALETAAEHSLVRLFPKFEVSDNPNWGKVVTKARDGAPDALKEVDHDGESQSHAVCKEVLASISASGTKGADLQRRFSEPPFGWPKDAINGAILVLFASHHIRAAQDGVNLSSPKELEPRQIGKTSFYKEDDPPTKQQQLAVRGLLTAAGIPYENGQEAAQLSALLQRLLDLASDAGGAPPLPEGPDVQHIRALQQLAGNQQFREVAGSERTLKQNLEEWGKAARQREDRQIEWSVLGRLLDHANQLEIAVEVHPQYEAIRTGRQLLDEPDPMAPLIDELTSPLRTAVLERAQRLTSDHEAAITGLEQEEIWKRLELEDRQNIFNQVGLGVTTIPNVSTDEMLLRALDDTPLRAWDERIRFVGARVDQARRLAAQILEPKSVSVNVRTTTIRTATDLEAYLDEIRDLVQPHLDADETVVI